MQQSFAIQQIDSKTFEKTLEMTLNIPSTRTGSTRANSLITAAAIRPAKSEQSLMVSWSGELPPAPDLDPQDLQRLIDDAIDFAFGNGLVLRPPAAKKDQQPSRTSVIHAPFALLPAPFPRALFEHAVDLQTSFNALYAHVTSDETFLKRVIGGTVARVDAFQGQLWRIWETVRKEGVSQDITLGLFRSDYMLHRMEGGRLTLQQVEFNTISSSFGHLACAVGDLHRYIEGPHSKVHYPHNSALDGFVDGLAAAYRAYAAQQGFSNDYCIVVMIVQDNERNVFDQRGLEHSLLARHGIPLLRFTFRQLARDAKLGHRRQLLLSVGSSQVEAAVVYFRAGYTPDDYDFNQAWRVRLQIEVSTAIKCPNVALQLAGAKKVQQVLSKAGESEGFIGRDLTNDGGRLDAAAIRSLRSTYTSLYPLDDTPLGRTAARLALESPEGYVLKPQREGGGNNIYRSDIPLFLAQLDKQDAGKPPGEPRAREGYILMDLIDPPPMSSWMCAAGQETAVRNDTISELGIYGVCLFRMRSDPRAGAEILVNKQVGHLLRTKNKDVSEGGVATGFSVLDSPRLV